MLFVMSKKVADFSKLIPIRSTSYPLPNEPILDVRASLLLKLHCLSMLFIRQLTHTAGNFRIESIDKYANSINNEAREVEFGSFDWK